MKPTDPAERQQEHLRKLRSEAANLRKRLKAAEARIAELESPSLAEAGTTAMRRELSKTRAECSMRRIEGRGLEAKLAEAHQRIATLIADLGDARQGAIAATLPPGTYAWMPESRAALAEDWHGQAVSL